VLVSLGFMTLGGFFLAHGPATPGVLPRGVPRELAAGSVVTLAGQLAMTVPAFVFAARYSPLLGRLRRSRAVTPRRLLAAVALAVLAFGADVTLQPVAMSDVERVVTGDHFSLEGERRTATILFTDLRGSTALAERVTPEQAVATVNAYPRAMARAVIDEGAILDKFTGDGLMAILGARTDARRGASARTSRRSMPSAARAASRRWATAWASTPARSCSAPSASQSGRTTPPWATR